MAEIEDERLAQKRVEELIAIGLYQARANRMKGYVRELYKGYEPYLKPLNKVREMLASEMTGEKTLSQEVVELRRKEIWKALEETKGRGYHLLKAIIELRKEGKWDKAFDGAAWIDILAKIMNKKQFQLLFR
ncbi:MAG: hypothetical protein ACUVQY_08130 [Thermoproteota archaeon]